MKVEVGMTNRGRARGHRYWVIALISFGLLATAPLVGKASLADKGETQLAPNPEELIVVENPLVSQGTDLAPDIQRIVERGKIIVAVFFEDVPPFFMHNKKGEFTGIDVEIAQDIANKLGVEVEFNRSPETFDEIVDVVANHEADVAISLLSDTLNRAMRVRFSDSYVELHQTLLINRLELAKRFPEAETADEINLALNQPGIKIGVISGTSYVDFVKETYPLATSVPYEDFSVMVEDVTKGTLFALLYDELEISNWKYANPDGGLLLKIVVLDKQKDTIAFAVHRDDVNLLAWLNLYLAKARDNGFLDSLLDTYLTRNEWRNQ